MNRFHYEKRCLCKEKVSTLKKSKSIQRSAGRRLKYPTLETQTQTFQIKCEKELSLIGKSILNSFSNKYIYYAIDDILDLLKTNKNEQETLLAMLYSPIISLQNNFSINFFDIWIQEVYIEETLKVNKFLKNDFETPKSINSVTIKFFYTKRVPPKKIETLW